MILTVNVAFALSLVDPILHQSLIFYEDSGENFWSDGDTDIDLDMHSAAGDNIINFFRVRGFPFGGGRSACEIGTPSERLLLSPPLGLGNLISPGPKESQPGVDDRDADGAGFSHGSLVFTSGPLRRSSRRTVVLLAIGISDVWRSFILAAAKIFHIFCGIHHQYAAFDVSGRAQLTSGHLRYDQRLTKEQVDGLSAPHPH